MARSFRAIIAAHDALEWKPARMVGGGAASPWMNSRLWGEADPVGELHWHTPDGAKASATIGDECWAFGHAGFWRPRIVAERESPARLTAHFEPTGLSGGILIAERGQLFRLLRADWRANWRWATTDGQSLMAFGADPDSPSRMGQVAIGPQAFVLEEFGLLLVLGWYLVTLQLAEWAWHGATEGPTRDGTAKAR